MSGDALLLFRDLVLSLQKHQIFFQTLRKFYVPIFLRPAHVFFKNLFDGWAALIFANVFKMEAPAEKSAFAAPAAVSLPGGTAKAGRNDPCPCGAKRPDGTPMKFKKCHGGAGRKSRRVGDNFLKCYDNYLFGTLII